MASWNIPRSATAGQGTASHSTGRNLSQAKMPRLLGDSFGDLRLSIRLLFSSRILGPHYTTTTNLVPLCPTCSDFFSILSAARHLHIHLLHPLLSLFSSALPSEFSPSVTSSRACVVSLTLTALSPTLLSFLLCVLGNQSLDMLDKCPTTVPLLQPHGIFLS